MLDAILAAATEEGAEATAWGFDAGGWVALSMVLVIAVMLYVKVPAIVAGVLDKRIAEIREQLDDAAKLRQDAEALKAEYEAKMTASAQDAEVLKAGAMREADEIVAQAKVDATALIARREKMAEEKIASAERRAIADLRAKAADAASTAARSIIMAQHSASADKVLVDQAIAGI